MATARKYAQLQPFTVAGAGSSLGDTSLVLQSFNDIDGNALTMSAFGTKGYGTLEPGSSTQEEQISFTGITANVNGTVTLTGVYHVAFLSPYTETSGMNVSHAGGVQFVISNTSGFYNSFANKEDEETINQPWTFTNPYLPRVDADHAYVAGEEKYFATKKYVDDTAFAGAPNASTTQKGIVQEATQAQVDARTPAGSTAARLFINPGTLRSTMYHDYAADAGGNDTYVITVTPTLSAYNPGDVFIFKANTANTGAASLNVNGVGAVAIKKYKGATLDDNDIQAGSIVTVVYDGTNLQLQNPPAKQQVSQAGTELYAASSTGNDTYAIALVPAVTAYVAGLVVRFKADVANTGAATLNVNGLGAVTIKKNATLDLADSDILATQVVEVVYDGTNFQMLSAISTSFSYAAGVMADLSTAAAGNNDLTTTVGFTPRVIKLTYFIQGADSSTGTGKLFGQKGEAYFYQSTALQYANIQWGLPSSGTFGGSSLTGVGGTPEALTAFVSSSGITTTIADLGAGLTTASGGGQGNIYVALSLNAISATGFTVRRATTIGPNPNPGTARARIAYEVWG